MKLEFFCREGNNISAMKWLDLMENAKYRLIKSTPMGNVSVQTEWRGLPDMIYVTFIKGAQTLIYGAETVTEALDKHFELVVDMTGGDTIGQSEI